MHLQKSYNPTASQKAESISSDYEVQIETLASQHRSFSCLIKPTVIQKQKFFQLVFNHTRSVQHLQEKHYQLLHTVSYHYPDNDIQYFMIETLFMICKLCLRITKFWLDFHVCCRKQDKNVSFN